MLVPEELQMCYYKNINIQRNVWRYQTIKIGQNNVDLVLLSHQCIYNNCGTFRCWWKCLAWDVCTARARLTHIYKTWYSWQRYHIYSLTRVT